MKSRDRIQYLRSNGQWSEVYSVDNPPPQAVTSVNNKTGAVSLSASDVGARPSSWTPTAADVGLGNVDNVKQYSASNPPPYPVTSVNGKTGAVTIDTGGSVPAWVTSMSASAQNGKVPIGTGSGVTFVNYPPE